MSRPLYAVILAGGSGTRFWPASRAARPKQFLAVGGDRPMLTVTRERLASRVPDERVLVVSGADQAELVRAALPGLPDENLLLEPVGRNTLPCVAWAAAEVRRRDPQAVQAILPADHVIAPEAAYLDSVDAAVALAGETDRLVTFGVRPTSPATGYGYIECGEALGARGGWAVHEVASFVEKPDRERAERMLASGRHLWNSGMFVWSTSAIVAALEQHAPATWAALRDADEAAARAAYSALEAVPVDVGVMERASSRAVIPVDYTWSDVGSWNALAEVVAAGDGGNHAVGGGALEALEARGNVVWSDPDTLTALIGVEGLVVVRSGDAVLVCPRERVEEVRALVERLDGAWR